MPQNAAANNFATTLAASATSSQTTLNLTTLTGAPAYPYLLTLTSAGASGPPYTDFEVVQVTSLSSGTTVNVTRGAQGTAQAWNSGDNAANSFTAGDANGLVQANWSPDWAKVAITGPINAGSLTTTKSGSGTVNGGLSRNSGIIVATGATSSSQAIAYTLAQLLIPPPTGSGLLSFVSRVQIQTAPAASGDIVYISCFNDIYVSAHGAAFQVTSAGTTCFCEGSTAASATNLGDANWHQCEITISATKTTFLIDGVQVAQIAATPSSGAYQAQAWFEAENGSASTTNVTLNVETWAIVRGPLS